LKQDENPKFVKNFNEIVKILLKEFQNCQKKTESWLEKTIAESIALQIQLSNYSGSAVKPSLTVLGVQLWKWLSAKNTMEGHGKKCTFGSGNICLQWVCQNGSGELSAILWWLLQE